MKCDKPLTVYSKHLYVPAEVEVDGYTYRESQFVVYMFVSLLVRGQLIKEIICSFWSKFFLLRVDPALERLFSSPEPKASGELIV